MTDPPLYARTITGGRVRLDAVIGVSPVSKSDSGDSEGKWKIPVSAGTIGHAFIGPFDSKLAAEAFVETHFPAVGGWS